MSPPAGVPPPSFSASGRAAPPPPTGCAPSAQHPRPRWPPRACTRIGGERGAFGSGRGTANRGAGQAPGAARSGFVVPATLVGAPFSFFFLQCCFALAACPRRPRLTKQVHVPAGRLEPIHQRLALPRGRLPLPLSPSPTPLFPKGRGVGGGRGLTPRTAAAGPRRRCGPPPPLASLPDPRHLWHRFLLPQPLAPLLALMAACFSGCPPPLLAQLPSAAAVGAADASAGPHHHWRRCRSVPALTPLAPLPC